MYIGVVRWRVALLVGLSFIVIGGGIVVVSGVPTQERTDTSSAGTITVEQEHYARAVDDASVYRPGEVLRGKSLYLLSDAPTVTVREVVRANDGPEAAVDVEIQTLYRVQYSNSDVYRERGVSVAENGTSMGGNVTAAMELDMTRVRDRLTELRTEFGGETSVQAVLVTHVNYRAGSSGSIVIRTPIQFTSNGYHIPETTKQEPYGVLKTSREAVPERTISVGGVVVGHADLFGSALVLVGLCVAGVSAGYLRRVTEADRDALYREVMHRRFSELIATVEAGECPPVDREMESLQDLVFVGEDAAKPVLYFPDGHRYVVQCDGIVYGYRF